LLWPASWRGYAFSLADRHPLSSPCIPVHPRQNQRLDDAGDKGGTEPFSADPPRQESAGDTRGWTGMHRDEIGQAGSSRWGQCFGL